MEELENMCIRPPGMSLVKMVLGVKISWTIFDIDIHPCGGSCVCVCPPRDRQLGGWMCQGVCATVETRGEEPFYVRSARWVVRRSTMRGTLEC